MTHALDRPVWMSLTTHHASLSEGNALARRFVRDVNLFASARDESPEALAALADLVGPQESVFLLQVPEINVPTGLGVVKVAEGVQMVAAPFSAFETTRDDMLKLGEKDAPEMLALATLTEPGPFLTRTHAMGAFLGIRINGQLAAMAGERMRFPGYTKLSGECTDLQLRS